MRINVYSQEITEEVISFNKKVIRGLFTLRYKWYYIRLKGCITRRKTTTEAPLLFGYLNHLAVESP